METECEYSVVDVSNNSTTVFTGACIYYGAIVTTALSAHALPILDGANTIAAFAASAAVGATSSPAGLAGIRCTTGIVVDPNDAATGTITVYFRRVRFD